MRICKLPGCKTEFEPTAPHQKFHAESCRFKYRRVMEQKLIKLARKVQKKAVAR